MSASNGVIRIGRKGTKKFAFGEDGPEFEVDVVNAFLQWCACDEQFRDEDTGKISVQQMPEYHAAAVAFVAAVSGGQEVTTAEALDFVARLREQYDALADFFQPKKPVRDESPDTSAVDLRFSVETVDGSN